MDGLRFLSYSSFGAVGIALHAVFITGSDRIPHGDRLREYCVV